MPRRIVPPPEKLTLADKLRLGFGLMMVPLGVLILARTLTLAVTVQGILVGTAFIGFGLHRLWLGWTRYQLLRERRRRGAP